MNAILQALKDKADMNDDGKVDKQDIELAIALGNQMVDDAEKKVTPVGVMFLVAISSFVLGCLAHKYYVIVSTWWAAF